MRISSRAFWMGLLTSTLLSCGGRSYRLGGENQGDPAAGSGGLAGAIGSGGTGTGGVGGEVGSAGTGGGSTTIIDVDGSPPLVQDGIVRIVSEDFFGVSFVAADEDHVYFNDWGGPVWRTRHDGSNRTLLAETTSFYLAVDASHVYWSTQTEIFRVPKVGGSAAIVTALDPKPETFAVSLALDDSHVYASTHENQSVVRAPKAGGAYEVMARTTTTTSGVAVGDRAVYFGDYTSNGGGTVQGLDLTSAATSVVFPSGAAMLLTAGDDLWFTHPGGNFELQFALARVPLDGTRATGYRAPSHSNFLASDESHVYWFRNGVLGRVDRSRWRDEAFAKLPSGEPMGLATSRQWVFVADGSQPGGIFRVPKLPL
jgi:hypothetical protein